MGLTRKRIAFVNIQKEQGKRQKFKLKFIFLSSRLQYLTNFSYAVKELVILLQLSKAKPMKKVTLKLKIVLLIWLSPIFVSKNSFSASFRTFQRTYFADYKESELGSS